MTPVDFLAANAVLAKDQPEYRPLPVWISPDGIESVSCWKLSWKDRFKLLWTGELWLRQLTFGDPLQPQLPQVDVPPGMV